MNSVRKSLTQYTNFIADEATPNDLHQATLETDSIDNDRTSSIPSFSQKASEFLEKLEKRKHNQLLELSSINMSKDSESKHLLNKERLLNPQPT